ncbi:phosphatase PAP2 family protein [Phocaeicola sp.]
MGIPFIVSGLIVKKQNQDFRTLRNRFQPTFHHEYDNYTQYVPLVATWGMKLAGVESRSSWKELTVSNVFSAALMAGFVNTLKYTTKEMRPDNSSNNSFPSGHTATAFMCATILHKEYGMLSPWYSIGGYTLAGITGITRQLNNRHWIGDVLVGAGIGMISTDLGYFLSDLIFRKNTTSRQLTSHFNHYDAPSFLSFNMGFATGPSTLRTAELYDTEEGTPLGMHLHTGTSTVVSAEGAYFFNPYIGLGGRLRVATVPVIADIPEENKKRFDLDNDLKEGAPVNMYLLDGLESDHLGMCDIDLGLYFSYPLSSRFLIGSKLLVGRRTNANFTLNSISRINPAIFDRQKVSQEAYDQFYKADVDYYIQQEGLSIQEMLQSTFIDEEFLHIRKSSTFKLGTGLSLAYRYKENAALRLYCDYDFASPRLTYDLKNSWADEDGYREVRSYSKRTPMHNFTFGASIAFMF